MLSASDNVYGFSAPMKGFTKARNIIYVVRHWRLNGLSLFYVLFHVLLLPLLPTMSGEVLICSCVILHIAIKQFLHILRIIIKRNICSIRQIR